MTKIVSLALKDLKLLWRDKAGFFWVLGFPLLMALFFGSIYMGGGGSSAKSMKIGIINENVTPAEQAFYDQLSKSDVLHVFPMSIDSAKGLVKKGRLVAYVHYIDSSKSEYNFFSGDKPKINVGIDPSRQAEAGYLNGLINQAYSMGLQKKFTDIDGWRGHIKNQRAVLDSSSNRKENEIFSGYLNKLDDLLGSVETIDSLYADTTSAKTDSAATVDNSPFGSLDIDFQDVAIERKGPRSSFEITFPQALQWALIATCASFSLSIVTERTRGTFLRLRIAPITRMHILAGKGLACFISCLAVCSLLMAIGIFIFGVGVGSWVNLVLSIVCAAICFVGLMMFIAVLGKTEASVGGAGWAILLVMSMLGGGMIPLMFIPSWMKTISHFSPVKWSILALEGSIWRGFAMSEMLLPLSILAGIGIAGFIIGTTILLRSDG